MAEPSEIATAPEAGPRQFRQHRFVPPPGACEILVVRHTILITQDGQVENRIIGIEHFTTQSELDQVANFLNTHLHGKTLEEVKASLEIENLSGEQRLRGLTEKLVADGIIHPLSSFEDGHIFIQGQSRLFEDPHAQQRLDEIRMLLSTLDEKRNILRLMDQVDRGEGMQVFIGSENPILKQPGWTTIIKAFRDQNGRIIGATGIIGPTRLNYGKIVPIVDYTSHPFKIIVEDETEGL